MKFSLVLLSLLGSLALCHADAVRLKISGPDGKPIAGAKVRILEIGVSRVSNAGPHSLPPLNLNSDNAGVVAFQSKNPFLNTTGKGPHTDVGSIVVANVRSLGLATLVTQLKAGNNALILQAGHALEGIVLDADQKPVAGAHLRVSQFYAIPFGRLFSESALPESITDASGHFRFDSLPTKGEVNIQVEDARWKHETFLLDLARKTPPLFLERGGTIKGRLLKPDGSPAAVISFGVGDFWNRRKTTTRADGTFTAMGLGDDNLYIDIETTMQKLPFVFGSKMVNNLQPGEVRDLGDWKAKPAVRAQGRVVDADTDKPLAGADVRLWGPSDAQGQTDAQGMFDILMEPGSTMVMAQAEGYVALTNPGVGDPKNGVIDIGVLTLKRGKTVSGLLLDDKGNVIPNYPLSIRKKNGNMGDDYARTGADGKFSLKGLGEGEYTVKLQGFKITQGEKFTLGTKTAPPSLRIVASALTPAGAPPVKPGVPTAQKVMGRIEALDGTPIAGAKIDLRLVLSATSYLPVKVLSQVDGSFSTELSLPFSVPGKQLKVLAVNRPGFLPGTTTVTPAEGDWKVTIKMQPKGAALRGRILNAAGQGVSGAFVGVQSAADLPVATDGNGDFTLKDVPLENITLLASNGPALASYDVTKAGQKIEITLPDVLPTTEADKAAAVDTLLQNASFGWEWKDQWKTLGQKRVEFIITHGGIGDDDVNNIEWAWGQYLGELARRDPQTFVAREAELRAATTSNNRALFEHLSLLCQSAYGNDEQKAKVRAYLKQEEGVKRDLSTATVTDLLDLAEISARLDPKAAQVWLDYAGQIADQLPDYGGEAAQQWGATIARTKKDAPLSFGDGWKPTVELMLLGSAMSDYLETGDLEDARRAYDRSKKLVKLAAQKSVIDIKTKPYGSRPSDLINQTTALYARILSRTDPLAALTLAPATSDSDRARTLSTIARSAVALKKFDVAKKAIEASFQLPYANMEYVTDAAALAQEFDPAYAQTLWPRVYAKARPRRSDEEVGSRSSFGAYAGARAALFPGQSRILIEREWQSRLDRSKQAKVANPDDDDRNRFEEGGATMSSLVEAMAKVYLPRALEMLPTITDRNNARNHTSLKLAIALLPPPPAAK